MIRFDDFLSDVDFGEASTNEKKAKKRFITFPFA